MAISLTINFLGGNMSGERGNVVWSGLEGEEQTAIELGGRREIHWYKAEDKQTINKYSSVGKCSQLLCILPIMSSETTISVY